MSKKASDTPCVCPTYHSSAFQRPGQVASIQTILAGLTENRTQTSHWSFVLLPQAYPIDDAKLTVTTPVWVWLWNSVRAIDHCVEANSSMPPIDELVDADARDAFEVIGPNLLKTKENWANEEPRFSCMLGVIKAQSC